MRMKFFPEQKVDIACNNFDYSFQTEILFSGVHYVSSPNYPYHYPNAKDQVGLHQKPIYLSDLICKIADLGIADRK